MTRRVKIRLDLTIPQAKALRRMLAAAVSYYEGANDRDGAIFERLEGKIGPAIIDAINGEIAPTFPVRP